jgi:hypothetical protein
VSELDFAYSTVCEVLILPGVGKAAQVVGSCVVVPRWSLWCASVYGLHGLAFICLFFEVNINGGLSSRLICVWTWCIGCLCMVLCSVPDQGVLGPVPSRRQRPYGQTVKR